MGTNRHNGRSKQEKRDDTLSESVPQQREDGNTETCTSVSHDKTPAQFSLVKLSQDGFEKASVSEDNTRRGTGVNRARTSRD